MTTPCCIVGKHPNIADIDRLIRAQQAASRANNATSVPSYSQIARTYGVTRPSLLRHRDECLTVDRGTSDAEASAGIASDSTTLTPPPHDVDRGVSNGALGGVSTRNGQGAPSDVDRGVHADPGQATGPPSDGTARHDVSRASVPDAAHSGADVAHAVPDVAARRDRGVVVGEADGAPATPSSDDLSRARAREGGRRGWTIAAQNSVERAARNLANTTADCAIRDPNARTHASYVEEVAEIVQSGEWENERTVQRLTRAWGKSKLFVVQCHSDACTLIRVARGSRFDQVESSAARWMNIYNIARKNEDPEAQRVALEALKGHDRVLGLVDSGTKVQVNILQDDGAQLLLRIVLEELADVPDRLARVRRRLMDARDKLGDPTSLLTTGEVAE